MPVHVHVFGTQGQKTWWNSNLSEAFPHLFRIFHKIKEEKKREKGTQLLRCFDRNSFLEKIIAYACTQALQLSM